ncbi:MAG: YdjY domain-containing protein [Planctomycetota bacterium]|nr:YdjY domain-containing protein [Planctomycetota bacterium]
MLLVLRYSLLSLLLLGLGLSGLPAQAPDKPEVKKTRLTKSQGVFLETEGKIRRVLVETVVVLRKGQLEEFLCRKNQKEHESILAGDFDARDIHTTLLLANGKAGSPVSYQPTYKAASGSRVKVSVRHPGKDGKVLEEDARRWVKNTSTLKELESDWVFAGSSLFDNPDDPKNPIYLANQGDVICLSNFNTAMLDLPIESSQKAADLLFEAWTDRIPPIGTRVTVVLEVVGERQEKGR